LLITANVPSAKKLIVHGPDLSQIPNQFPITENSQFYVLIQESFGFFKIPESKKDKYFLFDVKTSKVKSRSTREEPLVKFCFFSKIKFIYPILL
jgi:hypothetical protein